MTQSQNRKKRQRAKRKGKQNRRLEKVLEMTIKET